MKSPTSSVGTIELDGILKGSTRNERSRKTIRITGKKLIEYSTHQGWRASLLLRFLRKYLSSSQTRPVTTSRIRRKRAKFNAHPAAARRGTPPAGSPPHRPASC